MIGWHQLPAWSPITLNSVLSAVPAAARRGSGPRQLRDRLVASYPGAEFLLLDSGTSALACAMLAAAPAGRPPRIALPAYGCFDLMTAADIAGAEVAFYDLDPATLAPQSIDKVLSWGVDALVVAHWFGVPVDLAPLQRAAQAAGVVLIEDAAQGLGVLVGPVSAGGTGDLGILSFGRGKGRTGGHGGVLILGRPGVARRPLPELGPTPFGLATVARLAGQWLLGRPRSYWIPAAIPGLQLGVTRYQSPHPAAPLDEVAAAAVVANWDRSDQETPVRRRHAEAWRRLVEELALGQSFSAPPGTTAGWLRFPVRLAAPSRRVIESARGYGVMPAYPRLLPDLQPNGATFVARQTEFPGARELLNCLATFPTHSLVRGRDWAGCVRVFSQNGGQTPGRGTNHATNFRR